MSCEMTVQQIVEATHGQALSVHEKSIHGVGTDSRESLQNKIFIALKGDQYDAHRFLREAVGQGAKALLVHEDNELVRSLADKVTVVLVPNTLRALQDMARFWRQQLKAKVIGITGSNGKTSTKDFAKAIIKKQFKVHASSKSYNNHWGVPLTLLGASKFDEVVLVEMGMNHAGELTNLSKIAKPDIVICTVVGASHIGNFNSSVQAVADAKEEIYLSNPKALKIFNHDNEHTMKMFERVSKLQGADKTMAFSSFSAGAEVSLRATHMELQGLKVVGHIGGVKGEAQINIFGRHNVVNLMASSAIGLAVGMLPETIWAALPECKTEWGRNQLVKLENNATVLFDAYNANPDSTTALIKSMFEIALPEGGKKVAVLGEMLELGEETENQHNQLGSLVGNTDFDTVWFVGPSHKAFEAGIRSSGFNKNLMVSNAYEDSLAKKVLSMINPQDVAVIKGSRGMQLERVIRAWRPEFWTK